jgi:hypothetical protein
MNLSQFAETMHILYIGSRRSNSDHSIYSSYEWNQPKKKSNMFDLINYVIDLI